MPDRQTDRRADHRRAARESGGEIEGDGDGVAAADGEEDPRSAAPRPADLGYQPAEVELLSEAEGETPKEIVQAALRRAAGAPRAA